MRKALILSIITVFIASISSTAMAAEWSKTEEVNHRKMWYKFKRGVTNVLTSPAELPKHIKAEVSEHDGKGSKAIAALGGTTKGLAYSVARMGSGLWDMVSFNLSIPRNYAPLMQPEYVCEKE